MKVGVVGLGSIAQKAYLPVLGAKGLDLHLMTRSRERLDRVADAYRVGDGRRFEELEALIGAGVEAAFVHVPTDRHQEVVGRLLDAGVPTYVDKPLDGSVDGARALVERAGGTPLMVGFNRRYAPAYVAAAGVPRDLVVLQKNAAGETGSVREVVYDDFIHVVDTLRFLAPAEVGVETVAVSGRVEGDDLHHVAVTLGGDGFTAVGVMHRLSGSKEERLEVTGPGAKYEVVDLVEVVRHGRGERVRQAVDGWRPVGAQRGFEQICTAFLDGVRAGRSFDLSDPLRTHELCERVVAELS
ncbi:Gfo/Idh/MocA family oxidoreductase [Spirillospora sp. NPDC047279]|uniref:Gfo/Idh/MocA family protein n=1 Tax=Spirillospora sp. NPDC047279 TaxID=3155478 RepID=UPI0034097B3E